MSMNTPNRGARDGRSPRHASAPARRLYLRLVIASALPFMLAGCDDLLDVENPGAVQAEDLDNPALAATLLNSALGQFECAYTSYVTSTGILGQELINASSWLNINGWGWRGLELETITGVCPGGRNATELGAYTPLQQARYLAEDGARLISGFTDEAVPNKSEMLGLLDAYAGFSYVLLGEGFCEMAVDQGPLMAPAEVLQIAVERFTTALSHAEAAGNTDLALMARAGRARARLDLGDLEGAYNDAALIPPGFVWNAEYSTIDGSRENRLFNMNRLNRYISVEPVEYGNVMLAGQTDPRVPAIDTGLNGHDGFTKHWYQDKYSSPDSPIPMASWEEAQLIMAEARPGEAEAAINRLRDSQGLAPYSPSGDVLADILEERRRQLFLEGHRLNDMLRHDLPFPTGVNHKGQAWGPITCMPLPEQEKRANPNIS